MAKGKKIKVAITIGDLNGVGLEVILKTLSDSRVYEHCIPLIYGSEQIVRSYAKLCGLEGVHFVVRESADKADPTKINVINCINTSVEINPGTPSRETGKLAFESLKNAVEDLASNKADVLVTAPIDKKSIQSEDFSFPGHTEYLAGYANEDTPLMILVSEDMRVALATGHLPLREVADSISAELIVSKASVLIRSLKQDFGVVKPKVAVLALNPHAGDNGLLGEEETKIIEPAIEQLQDENHLVFGPYGADGFFGSGLYHKFDGVLAMYHDQGLAPFKALSFNFGVNFTAGLPIVRTSPDHGTAYDIAGKGMANEQSFRSALFMACDIYRQRQLQRQLEANALG
ncbi:MAG: 4-hydroxythreonine-4-phosphate dehydrogenase PdxA [Salibacteraceae bacterium]